MQSEKSALSPRLPPHCRSDTISSYGSVKTFNSKAESLAASFQESFIQRYGPATAFHTEEQIPERIAESRPNFFRRTYTKLSRLVVEWWLWELISWAMSAICICGMAIVLSLFNDRPLPARWPGGITLNAYISVLSGAGKFLMAVPLDSALGQLKWLWFWADRPRNLADFERFDNASRGPWGALTLLVSGSGRYVYPPRRLIFDLLSRHGRSLASLGALVTILSLALDPFFQQVVSYPQRSGSFGLSYVSRAVGYYPNVLGYENSSLAIFNDALMQSYLQSYFLENATQLDAPFDCPSGNCSWSPYKTLGLCSSCIDAGDLLSFDCKQELGDWLPSMADMVVPNYQNETEYPGSYSCGHFMDAGLDGRILMNGYSLGSNRSSPPSMDGPVLLLRLYELQNFDSNAYYWEGTGHFNNIQSPFEHFVVVSGADTASVYANTTPAAQECMLSWCEKTIHSTFSDGQYSEEIISSFVGINNSKVPAPFLTRVIGAKQYELLDNVTVFGSEPNTTYSIENVVQLAARFTIGNYFPAFGIITNSSATVQPMTVNSSGSSQLITRWRPGNLPHVNALQYDSWGPSTNVSAHVADLATLLTNIIRISGNMVEKVIGPGAPETFISISWGWFVLPLMLEFATLILLLATMRKSRSKEGPAIWKSSSLATLMNGLSDDVRNDLGNSQNIMEFREKAEHVSVRLNPVSNGFGLDW